MTMKTVLFLLTVITAVFSRLYLLDSLPGEWFGDISNVHEYMMLILAGKWPFYFFQSPGPVYHYLIAPLVIIFKNNGYLTYKISSVIVSLAGLVSAYFFIKAASDRKTAMTGILVMGISFWYLIWSRIGNSQIVIVLLSCLLGYFLLIYTDNRKLTHLYSGAMAASLGLYTYPQTFIFPVIFTAVIFFVNIYSNQIDSKGTAVFTGRLNSRSFHIISAFIIILISALPFRNLLIKQNDLFTNGYVGEKVFSDELKKPEKFIIKFIENYKKTLLMFHVKGDGIFRVNVPGMPAVDRISGFYLLIGIPGLYIISRKKLLIILFLTLFLLIPTAAPAINPSEIPSSSRTVAVIPFIILFIAVGIRKIEELMRVPWGKAGTALISVLFILSAYINYKNYFISYPQELPDRNFPAGKIIATHIDRNISPDTSIYFGSCCWGAWGQPEPKSIAYQMKKEKKFIEYGHFLNSCKEVRSLPAAVIVGPKDLGLIEEYRECFPDLTNSEVKDENDNNIFMIISVNR